MTDLEIRYFLEIVNQGPSFTKAAQSLYVSQPALTHHIKVLGEELEVQLFDTSLKNAVKLTPAGKLYFDFFSEYRKKFEKVRNKARGLAVQETGSLRFASMGGWDITALLDKKKTFRNAFPYIDFSIVAVGLRRLRKGFFENQYDLVLTMSDQFRGESNVNMYDYARIPYILLFSSTNPLAKKDGLSVTDFKDENFFCLSDEETGFLKGNHESYCKSKGFIPRFEFLPNMESILLALENGSGYTIFDDMVQIKRDPRFKYICLDNYLTVSYAWKADNDNRALKLFLETCVFSR